MWRKFFRKSKSSDTLALSRIGNAMVVASVSRTGEKPRVLACQVLPFAENTLAVWQGLSGAARLKGRHCTLLLSPNEYQLIQIDAPAVPAEEMKAAVRWKLKDMLSYPVEQASVDAVLIQPDPRNPSRGSLMYAVAARNDVVRSYLEHIEGVDAELDVVDVPELAQRNLAMLLEEEDRGLALLSVSEDGGLLTYTSGGELYHARQIELNTYQLAAPDAEQRAQNFERLVLELQRSLDNFERQFSYVSVTRLVLGPMPGQAVLEEYLKENLYIRVESLNLADVLNITGVEALEDPVVQSQCFLALAAALREEGASA